jgi:hypothetical protein
MKRKFICPHCGKEESTYNPFKYMYCGCIFQEVRKKKEVLNNRLEKILGENPSGQRIDVLVEKLVIIIEDLQKGDNK